jgi:hypothetical protein
MSMSLRSVLRCQARELAGGMCDWPSCNRPGQELAHLHSVGAGGRRSADTLGNVAFLCGPHARMSDGEQPACWPDGTPCGWPGFTQSHTALLGEGWETRIPMSRWGFERAEALTRLIAKKWEGT